jgi:hypothetical protein
MDASSATSGPKDANEQPDATSLGKGAHPEVAKDQTLGVNNPTGDGNTSAQNSKAPPNTEPPKLLVSHVNPDQLKVGEEQNVATRFYSLSPAAICEIAFKGLDPLRDKFKMTWIQADISGSVIVDDLMVSTLDQTLRELEESSKITIPFSFQRIKMMQNIVAAIHCDQSLEEAEKVGLMTSEFILILWLLKFKLLLRENLLRQSMNRQVKTQVILQMQINRILRQALQLVRANQYPQSCSMMRKKTLELNFVHFVIHWILQHLHLRKALW